MNDRASRIAGVVVIVMGLIVLATDHSWWGLRGVAYMGYGIYIVLKGVRK